MIWRRFINTAILLWLSLLAAWTMAEQPPRISELSNVDLEFMAQQRTQLQELAALKLGRQFSGDTTRDLDLLQTLLDQQLVRADQTLELQAMGVILGDLLAADLDMHWVVYEDAHGRSRALRYRNYDEVLFPVTMIARRREAGSNTPVAQIYRRAHDIAMSNRPALPFQ